MKVREELKAYIDGELKPEEANAVQEQVEASNELAQEVAFLKLLGQEIREMVQEPAVDGATETLDAVARHPRVSRWRIWGGALGLAATLMLIAQLPGMLAQAKRADGTATMAHTAFRKDNNSWLSMGDRDDVPAAPAAAAAAKSSVKLLKKEPSASDLSGYGGASGTVHPSDVTLQAPAAHPYNYNGTFNGTPLTAGKVEGGGGFAGVAGERGGGTWIVPKAEKVDQVQGQVQGVNQPQTVTRVPMKQHVSARAEADNAASRSAKAPLPAPAQPARMVIQNGTLDVYVQNVTEAENRAINLAKGVGGFVSNSSYNGGNVDNADDTPSAQVELRVPVMQFTNAMQRLRSFVGSAKDIKTDQVSGNDVTAQYADDEGRLRELHAEESDYVEMLKKVRHMDDILSLKDRLSSVRQDISGYESQVATLKDQSAMSTIDATFEMRPKVKPQPKVQTKGWADDAWASAEGTRSDAMKSLATLGIFLVAWCPIWLPIGIGAWWLTRRTR